MKKSEKLSLAVSVILFVLSAVFSIALLAELFSASSNNTTVFHSIGGTLLNAYGAGSALIPIFLLAAGILCLMPTWSVRRWLLLSCSIIPFFTIIITEKLCKGFSAEGDLLGAVKIGITVVICVLLLILEYLACCIAADKLESWISDHFSSDEDSSEAVDDATEQASLETVEDSSLTVNDSSETVKEDEETVNNSTEEAKAEEETESVGSESVAATEVQEAEDDTEDNNDELVESDFGTVEQPMTDTEQAESIEKQPVATTAMFSVSLEEIEKARQAEQAELATKKAELDTKQAVGVTKQPVAAEKKKLTQTNDDKTLLSTQIANEDDSFVIVPVAEDEAAFITDDSPVEKDENETIPAGTIDLSITGAGDVFSQDPIPEPTFTQEEPPKPSVFDKAIEAVNEKARQSNYNEGDTLDADFFDIDMNAEDEDERAEREEREKVEGTFSPYEDRPLIIEKPIVVGEYDKSVSEPLNPVFAKMEQDVQSEQQQQPEQPQQPQAVSQEAQQAEPDSQEQFEQAELIENDSLEEKPSLLQTAIHLKEQQPQAVSQEAEPVSQPQVESEEQSEPDLQAQPVSEETQESQIVLEHEQNFEEQQPQAVSEEQVEPDLQAQPVSQIAQPVSQIEQEEPVLVQEPQIVSQEPIIEEETEEQTETESQEPIFEEQAEIAVAATKEAEVAIEQPVPVTKQPVAVRRPYSIPTDILTAYSANPYWEIDEETKQAAENLTNTLSEFKIDAEVTGIRKGPVVTMFEMLPAPGVKLSKIVALQDNIALRLAAKSVRIVAPIPGKRAVGIEVPNKERAVVSFREIIEEDNPAWSKMAVPVVLGKDISGESKIMDLVKTPHLLIAGATGAGKSVCVNSLILSVLFKRSPEQVRLILIDPKIVELKLYNDIPHLLTPVITEPKRAFQALQYCLCEMERRYALLDGMQVRDIESYNRRIVERNIATEKLPYIVVIIDEFADLMATSGKELETTVARLCAMSRAVGIHLVLATQRPSIDVITGLIKANIPSRIAFMVASKMDSRIIIDQIGAEKLLGKGDMLYAGVVDPFPTRIQGTLVNDLEVENVVDYVKQFGEPDYIDDEIFIDDDDDEESEPSYQSEGEDPLYDKALDIVIQAGKASASYIQRRLKIGYNRAARLVEEMEARGIVGPANGSKPREIIHMP